MGRKANSNDIFRIMGASSHCKDEREEHDYYATHPKAVEMLLELEQFDKNILEPCCGEGHISNVLEQHGHTVTSFDLIDRGYGTGGIDFLKYNVPFDGDIVTNPPYEMAQDFVEHAMDIVADGHKIAMFLKLTFLEGNRRREMYKKYPPKVVYVSSDRLACGKNGDFYKRNDDGTIKTDSKGNPVEVGSAVCYCWYIWEKGYKGDTIVKHFN